MKITSDQLDTMHTLEQAATKGPWNVVVKGNSIQSHAIPGVCSGISPKTGNADFIGFSRWFVPHAIEHIRFTEASTEEALLILDDAVKNVDALRGEDFLAAIDFAIQKLRPVAAPVHDAEALAQLPAGLWQDEQGVVYDGTDGDRVMEKCEKCGAHCLPEQLTDGACICESCQLAMKHPIELPWMHCSCPVAQGDPVCGGCQKGGGAE